MRDNTDEAVGLHFRHSFSPENNMTAEAIESALHRKYASKRIRGECFNLNNEDIEAIKQTLK